MDNNNDFSPTKTPNYGDQSAMIHCGLCIKASFQSRNELYEHFQNHHGINQQFRHSNVIAARAKGKHSQKMGERRPTFQENRQHEQNNVLNNSIQTVMSNVPINIEPAVASSSVQNSPPPLYYLPTSADFIAGFKQPPPPQYPVYQPTIANTLFNAHALAASLGCFNFGNQFLQSNLPFGTGSVDTAFGSGENAMSGLHNGNNTEEKQPADDIPSEFSRDDITVVNSPTDSI
ncbi:uncharacterized protein LOC119078779 [Bradysia coprophila]|uniref:uncharacterized protein LOC119078779 n=1 Tax=Bradysia coprophila TaxID=38358 RepID=UPI00187DD929|nr:uncharacterized protein LOC119078779 [Bradysia coprophila]